MRFSLKKKNGPFRKNYMKASVKKLLRTGMMPARTLGAHAVGVFPTERLKLKRQMAAAAGKKSTTSLSLFMEAFGLEVEEELSTMAVQYWAEGVWTAKWRREQKRSVDEADSRNSEVETVEMCETRDLGIKWPCWHTLVFSNEMTIDMRYVCPKDVRKKMVQRVRSENWKKWVGSEA